MKTITVAAAFLLIASVGQAQSLTTEQAKAHEGENATVCGSVASERTATGSRGEPTFINLDSAYPKQVFTILVWGDDRKNVGELPRVGSHVCAKGQITDYHGVPEIVVRNSGQLRQVNVETQLFGSSSVLSSGRSPSRSPDTMTELK